MSTSITSPDTRPRATAAMVDDERLRVSLSDGRDVSIPTSWYAWLHDATAEQQADITIIDSGLGLWWELLDDGISVPGLLGQPHV
jgi:uncharacterized protein DUF2442